MEHGICSFTGHRRIAAAHAPYMADLLARSVGYAYSEGCRDFMTGGALGFDTLAADAVLHLRETHPDVRLILCLPCRNQDVDWSESQRRKYREIAERADEVIYVSDRYTPTCMRERNLVLAERCDILIAYVGYSASGSAQTARMAERLGRRVYNIYPSLDEKSRQNAPLPDRGGISREE